MNFDLSSITGFFVQALNSVFGTLKLSGETGNGLLKFVEFFGASLDFIVKLFTKLFSGLAG